MSLSYNQIILCEMCEYLSFDDDVKNFALDAEEVF